MSQANVIVPPAAGTTPAEAPVVPAIAPPAPQPASPAVAPLAPPVAVAPVVSGAQPADPNAPPPQEPNWLKPRLGQAENAGRKSVFAALNVKDEAEAKALVEKARQTEEAQKTELQKAQDRNKELEARAARATVLEDTVKRRVETELAGLTDAQKAAVAAVAGDDPARTLATIDALKPTWIAAAPLPAAPTPAPSLAVPPAPGATPPATTSPPPTAPGSAPGSPPNHKAEWESLKAKNPHAAALYLNKHVNDIYPRP